MTPPSRVNGHDHTSLMPRDGWLRRYIDLFTPLTEAPAEAHLATALAVLSSAVGWRAHIQWGTTREPANLFVMLEGGSATAKKTTTARTGRELVIAATKGLDDLPEMPLQVRSVSHTSRRGLLELVGTTDQAIAKAWDAAPPPGVLLDWDEFGAVLGRPGDTKGGDWLGQIRATLMELYGGRHGGIQTGELKFPPTRCAVSVLATMTRVELEQRVSTGLLRDGFLGRFVLIPHPGRARYLPEPPVFTSRDAEARDTLAHQLRRVAMSKQEVGSIFRRMTGEARELREEWYMRVMPELDKTADHGGEMDRAIADAAGRLQTTAVKIAAISAVSRMDFDGGEELSNIRIDEEDVALGIAFFDFALAEVASLAREGGGLLTDRYSRMLVDWLRTRKKRGEGPGEGPREAKRKEIMDNVRMDGLSAFQRWRVVEDLVQDSTVEILEEKTGGRPCLVARYIA